MRFVSVSTRLAGGLLLISTAAGISPAVRPLYTGDPMEPALIAQDIVGIAFGFPLLVIATRFAESGSLRGLLAWMGALFYLAYFWFFHVVGVRFNPLFPIHVALVSIGMYGALYLVFGTDMEAVRRRFSDRLRVNLIAAFLMGTAVLFAMAWANTIAGHIAAGTEMDRVTRLVVAIDLVVLLPLMFFGGYWLWRRQAVGYVLAAMLLVKNVATFLTLTATTLLASLAGMAIRAGELAAYAAGLAVAIALLIHCLRSVEETA